MCARKRHPVRLEHQSRSATWLLAAQPSMPSSLPTRAGFTAIPNAVLDAILCQPLSRREISILLLVARLTFGCRNIQWAHIKQADLVIIGIGPNHAKGCLLSLLAKNFLVQHGSQLEYCVNTEVLTKQPASDTAERLDRLSVLIGQHLGATSHKGKISPLVLPEMGTELFPKEELLPSRKGNISRRFEWSFSRSSRQFEKDLDTS
jgi:hypothetical protein